MPLSLLIDEDTRDGALWDAIQRHNASAPDWAIDAIRVGDDGAPATGTLDPGVIDWAAKAGRIIVSRDVNTLIAEHDQYVAGGNSTPGLLIVRRGFSIPEVVEISRSSATTGMPPNSPAIGTTSPSRRRMAGAKRAQQACPGRVGRWASRIESVAMTAHQIDGPEGIEGRQRFIK